LIKLSSNLILNIKGDILNVLASNYGGKSLRIVGGSEMDEFLDKITNAVVDRINSWSGDFDN